MRVNMGPTVTNDGARHDGYVTYRCDHEGIPFVDRPPSECDCGAAIAQVWMVSTCGDCGGRLYYPRGIMLRKPCRGDGVSHEPAPASIGDTP
jgi:hypothetical protein